MSAMQRIQEAAKARDRANNELAQVLAKVLVPDATRVLITHGDFNYWATVVSTYGDRVQVRTERSRRGRGVYWIGYHRIAAVAVRS